MKPLAFLCAFSALIGSCSNDKKAKNHDLVTIESQDNRVTKQNKTLSNQKIDVNNPGDIVNFFKDLDTNPEALEHFKNLLSNGDYSKIELLQLQFYLQQAQKESADESLKNSGNKVKESSQNLFKTVSSSTDKLLQKHGANPQMKTVEQLIQDQLQLIDNQNVNKSNQARILGNQKLKEFLSDYPDNIIQQKLNSVSLYGTVQKVETLEAVAAAEDDAQIMEILTGYFKMNENEIRLIQKIPEFIKYDNEKDALENLSSQLHPDIENHLKSENASKEFVKFVTSHKKEIDHNSRTVLNKSKKARSDFKKLNPSWFGYAETQGNVYIDEKGKAIYLPLGAASFADRVVSHQTGNPAGGFSPGALGAPDMSMRTYEDFNPRVCNVGINGVLTLEFIDNALVDVTGPDLFVFELGEIEATKLEISKDGKNWIEVGTIEGGTAAVDIQEFVRPGETFHFVRITDLNSPSVLPGADIDAVAVIGGAVRLQLDSSVLFEFGKYHIKPDAKDALTEMVQKILQIEKGTILIEGHTDNVGNANSNQILSKNRAESVAEFLKNSLGETQRKYQWKTQGFGDSQPIVPNDTEENRQLNRRVEILIIPTG